MVENTDDFQEVPFDMVKETLKSIRLWIDKITKLSIGIIGGVKIDPNDIIIAKHKMVQALIVLSSSLLSDSSLEEIEVFFSKIKIKCGDINTAGVWKRNVPIYTTKVDYELDECIKGIQKGLKNYFKPTFNKGEKY